MAIEKEFENYRILPLLVAIVIFISFNTEVHAQEEVNSDTLVSGYDNNEFQITNQLFLNKANYRLLSPYPIEIPARTIMEISPLYSFAQLPSYGISGYIHTSHITGYTDPVAILAEVFLNSTLYLFEQRKNRKKDPRYKHRF